MEICWDKEILRAVEMRWDIEIFRDKEIRGDKDICWLRRFTSFVHFVYRFSWHHQWRWSQMQDKRAEDEQVGAKMDSSYFLISRSWDPPYRGLREMRAQQMIDVHSRKRWYQKKTQLKAPTNCCHPNQTQFKPPAVICERNTNTARPLKWFC